MENLGEFRRFHLLQLLSALLQFFECLDDGFRHPAMSFLRATDDRKLLTRGDAFVAVFIIETDAQQTRSWLTRLFLFAHAFTVLGLRLLSIGKSSSTALQTISENA